MSNERTTDQFVRDMLREIGFARPWEQNCADAPVYIYDALKQASKSGGAGRGKPEFVVESSEFLVVVEDKAKYEESVAPRDEEGLIDRTPAVRIKYALNGAVHYAKTFAEKTKKKVFAVGVAGTESHYDMTVAFVEPGVEPKELDRLETLAPFAEENINEYYRVAVRGELPQEEREGREIRKVAAILHEGMRNYASLENENKATLVSAILLALKYRPELLDDLTGDRRNGYRDGEKVYNAAKEFLESPEADLGPKQKIGIMLDRFSFIKRHVLLNRRNEDLGMTPLQYFTEILDNDVFEVFSDPSYTAFDVLGNFYGEFVKYGGSDGNSLGIVLTPHHVTDLMTKLVDVNSDDVVLDPTAGSGSFLIAAMRRMFDDAMARYEGDEARRNDKLKEIKRFHLYGVELQDKLFAVGTTNMILRNDGKANFQRHNFFDVTHDDFFPYDPERPGRLEGFTKVLMNPPYSQSKDRMTRHLSELSFIERALSQLEVRGRLAAIVPQSAMVGKTKEDRTLKAKIMKHHTLDAVLTMNPDTFHGLGNHVVIVLFTAGVPHPDTKKTVFVDFKDDGYKVWPHVGLVDDGRAFDRRKHVLEVVKDGIPDDTSFVVHSEVTATDEWQHSYFYFNDQPPSYEDFYATVADYLTWQVDMHTHGRGHLITPSPEGFKDEDVSACSDDLEADDELPELRFGPMMITDVFETMKASKAWYDKSKLNMKGVSTFPFISRMKASNGIDGFCPRQEKDPEPGNVLTIGLDTQTVAYQPTPFYTSQNIQVLRDPNLTRDNGMILVEALAGQMEKFSWGGNGATLGRLKKTRIMVPVFIDSVGEQVVDWNRMTRYGRIVRARNERDMLAVLGSG